MPFEPWVAVGAAMMVLVGWASVLSSLGTVEAIDEGGIRFRSLIGKRTFIHWNELRGPSDRFLSFMPRLVLKRVPSHFFRLHRSYGILITKTAPEILAEIEKRYGVRDVTRLGQLLK